MLHRRTQYRPVLFPLIWVLIAQTIAIPLSLYALNGWLKSYAYRTDLNFMIFLSSGFVALLTAFLAVTYQSLKTANIHPAETLKYE